MKLAMLRRVSGAAREGRGEQRATFSSLRACRESIQIARWFLFRKRIDVTHITCPLCETSVDCSHARDFPRIACRGCGVFLDVPGHVRGRVRAMDPEERVVDASEENEELKNQPNMLIQLVSLLILCCFAVGLIWIAIAIFSVA